MFSKKEVIPVQDYRIDVYPSWDDLSSYTEKARQVCNMKHAYIWEDREVHKTYKFSILARDKKGDIEWWLHEDGVTGSKMVWFYKSKDLALIFTQLCEAVGAPETMLKEEIEAHREHKKNFEKSKEKKATLGDRLVKKKPRDITAGAHELDDGSAGGLSGGLGGGGLGGETAPPMGMAAEQESLDPSQYQSGAQGINAEDIASNTMSRLMGGDIKIRPIGAIMHTAAQSDVTGHLTVTGGNGKVVVQFGLGKVVHAYSDKGEQGTEAILELFTWKEGQADFVEGVQPEAASVQETNQEIVQQGEALMQNFAFLEQHKINEISVLQKPPLEMSEDKIIERLQDGALLGIKVQKYFIDSVDGGQTVSQIAGKANLNKCRWVGIVGNLLKLGLVHTPDGQSLNQTPKKQRDDPMQLSGNNAEQAFQQAAQQSSTSAPTGGAAAPTSPTAKKSGKAAPLPPSFIFNKQASGGESDSGSQGQWPSAASGESSIDMSEAKVPEPVVEEAAPQPAVASQYLGVPQSEISIEQSQADAGKAKLLNQETGIYEFDSFQFLLNNEFARAFRFGTEFTLVLFCINISNGTASAKEVSDIAKTVNEITREVDYLGHFGEKAFGIILPGISCEQATILCQRIATELPMKLPDLAKYQPSIHFGLAAVPADAQELRNLVTIAQQAMLMAAQQSTPYVIASQLGQ